MASFRQPGEQTGAACRNRAWMIASPRMAAEPDDRLALLTGENQLLERLAQGEELEPILDGVCRMVEGIFRDSFVSIMLVNPDDHRLWYAASGSLPPAYTEALNGLEVGPSQGSCGAAAYRNAPVIVDDVVSDPLWVQYRDVAAQFGLRSCWSTPIRSADGRVMGTFAVLSRQPGTPTPHDQRVVAEVTHLASLAIAHKRNEDTLRRNQQELRQVIDAIPQLIVAMSPAGQILYANQSVLESTGLSLDEVMAAGFREWLFHPDDLQKLRSDRSERMQRGIPFELEMRARLKDRQYRWFLVQYKPLIDGDGRRRTMVRDGYRHQRPQAG